MGKTIVKVKLWNIMDEEKVKRREIFPVETDVQIDNGAVSVVLTRELAESLKLIREGEVWVKYADERRKRRDRVTGLRIEINGRRTVCGAIIEPKRKMPLVGQIVLEDLDLWIDSKNGRLVPNPESPDLPLLDLL